MTAEQINEQNDSRRNKELAFATRISLTFALLALVTAGILHHRGSDYVKLALGSCFTMTSICLLFTIFARSEKDEDEIREVVE